MPTTNNNNSTTQRECINCGDVHNIADHEFMRVDDGYACENCARRYHECYECTTLLHEDVLIGAVHNGDSIEICEHCWSEGDGFTCERCDTRYYMGTPVELDGQNFCNSCFESIAMSRGLRRGRMAVDVETKDYQSAKLGTIIQSPRGFGVEIECKLPTTLNVSWDELHEMLPKGTGLAHDGSINGNGVEIQTPILAGEAGEKYIKEVCATLVKVGAKVDASTGLHVHISSQDIAQTKSAGSYGMAPVTRLMRSVLMFEDVIHSFIPFTRRGNRYCLPLRFRVHLDELSGSPAKLEQVWYRTTNPDEIDQRKQGKGDNTRYCGYNFHMLFSEGHHEVRYHSGTTNPTKILQWANLHLRLADASITSRELPPDLYHTVDIKPKTAFLYDYIALSATSRDYFNRRQKTFANNGATESTLQCAE